jgi:hypothetical protein
MNHPEPEFLRSFDASYFLGKTLTERLSIIGNFCAREGWAIDRCDAPPDTYTLFETMAASQPSRYRLTARGMELLVLGRWVWLTCTFGKHKECAISCVRPGDADCKASAKVVLYDPDPVR